MTICKELPSKTLLRAYDRTLVATGCLSLVLHLLIISPILYVLIVRNTLPAKDLSIEVTIVPSNAIAPPAIAAAKEEQAPPPPAPLPVEQEVAKPSLSPQPVQSRPPTAPKIIERKERKKAAIAKTIALPEHQKAVLASYAPIALPEPPTPEEAPLPFPSRYEQTISLWFKHHRLYDDLGTSQALLRIRIHKDGAVTSYRLEQSTGNDKLDRQIIATVKNASPFPPIPAYYSRAEDEEFLLPINTPTTQE